VPLTSCLIEEIDAPAESQLHSAVADALPATANMPSESEGSNPSTTVTPQRASTGSAQTSEDSDTASSLDGATAINRRISRIELQSALGPDFGIGSTEPLPSSDSAPAALKEDLPEDEGLSTDSAQEEGLQAEMPGSEVSGAKSRPRHYWGQALQYLEKSADVTKGMLMTRSTSWTARMLLISFAMQCPWLTCLNRPGLGSPSGFACCHTRRFASP